MKLLFRLIPRWLDSLEALGIAIAPITNCIRPFVSFEDRALHGGPRPSPSLWLASPAALEALSFAALGAAIAL